MGAWMKAGKRAASLVIALAFAGCGSEPPGPPADQAPGRPQLDLAAPAAGEPAGPAAPTLEDVVEHDPRYVVGISFPPEAGRYPGLAAALEAFARSARADLDEAVASLGEGRPRAPYDLVLDFAMLAETPRVVAVAADGSCYTGGAHGNPIVARFVWLPQQQRMLEAGDLLAPEGWQAVSGYVREELHAQLLDRLGDDDLSPDERSRVVRSAGRMIDDGSTPDPANFAHFEPVMDGDGNIGALRFVFPPYQVGPYSDGTRTVVVPAALLLPHVAPSYRELFAAG